MSRAFVKEESGERWTPPEPVHELRVWLGGESVYETDDLPAALRWLAERPPRALAGGFQVRTREGRLLAEGESSTILG